MNQQGESATTNQREANQCQSGHTAHHPQAQQAQRAGGGGAPTTGGTDPADQANPRHGQCCGGTRPGRSNTPGGVLKTGPNAGGTGMGETA